MRFAELLNKLTVDSKDNGIQFQEKKRLETIKSLLETSDYQLLEEGDLSLVYVKSGADIQQCKSLISSHIDCVYTHCFVEEADEKQWKGTFDNSATNAALVELMLKGVLSDSVMIAFTGDEEIHTHGAQEVMRFLAKNECRLEYALVLDVTNEGWSDEAMFTVENDRGFDIITGYQIIALLQQSEYPCNFLHDAEPDETWEYGKGMPEVLAPIPCLSLCLPVEGNMHSDEGVHLRKASIEPYQQVLAQLANMCGE